MLTLTLAPTKATARLLQLGFKSDDIVYRENMKLAQIGPTLREFKSRLGPQSVALVFYAGHSLQIRGENYLPMADARIEGEEDVPQQSLKLSLLMNTLPEAGNQMNLVFLYACRNNPYKRSFRDMSRGLGRTDGVPSGALIAYAGLAPEFEDKLFLSGREGTTTWMLPRGGKWNAAGVNDLGGGAQFTKTGRYTLRLVRNMQ